jgi:hypothetical protein
MRLSSESEYSSNDIPVIKTDNLIVSIFCKLDALIETVCDSVSSLLEKDINCGTVTSQGIQTPKV